MEGAHALRPGIHSGVALGRFGNYVGGRKDERFIIVDMRRMWFV